MCPDSLILQLWSKVHSPPDVTQQWTIEEMLAADYFDEFVGSCFDIAEWLDAPVPSTD